jgi:hypothetical protein
LAVEEEQGTQGLVLGGSRHFPIHGQIGSKTD